MREVAVIGIGITKFGELWESSLRTLAVQAALAAIDDSGVDKLDSMYIGCMTSGLFVGQEHLGSLIADYIGNKNIAATRVESACASGGAAFKSAVLEVSSGASDIVMALGVEKMTDIGGDGATFALSTAADIEYEGFHGATFPGLYALMARAHMLKYGTTREQLAHVAVKNHYHGAMNKRAQYPFEITVEQVINSTKVADPLNILDCSPITDGAAAAIVVPLELAKKLAKKPIIKVIGFGHATDSIALADRKNLYELRAVEIAAQRAYSMANKGPGDIDVAEVHDCFTIAEIMVIEALGFVEKGRGGTAAESGLTKLGGKIPVNTSGGLKSKGHPVGATGIAQIVELTEQLRGQSGERQVSNARVALAQNMGGSGGSSIIHILEVI